MYSGAAMKSMAPHERANVYKNQTVGAVWLLIGVGVLTLASPLMQLGAPGGVEPGLLAPATVGRALGQVPGSAAVLVGAGIGGGLLVLLGVLLGFGRASAGLIGVLVIAADWPLVLIAGRATDFPELFTSVFRLFYLFYILRGVRAVGLRAELLATMRQADKGYEEELKKRARKRGAQGDQPIDSRMEPEDEYQG